MREFKEVRLLDKIGKHREHNGTSNHGLKIIQTRYLLMDPQKMQRLETKPLLLPLQCKRTFLVKLVCPQWPLSPLLKRSSILSNSPSQVITLKQDTFEYIISSSCLYYFIKTYTFEVMQSLFLYSL
jgi:hypothetical protein